MDTLLQDINLAFRTLRTSWRMTLIALLCLGLGVGANAAIFSVVNAVLLRPFPYADPERLAYVYETFGNGSGWGSVSYPNFQDWRTETAGTFSHLAAWENGSVNLQGVAEPERLLSVAATDNLFALLGTKPLLGRTFAAGEDQPGQPRVVVLSEGLWRRRFDADPNVVGRIIILDAQPHTIIGVMPATFSFPAGSWRTDAFVPLKPTGSSRDQRGSHNYNVVARLARGITMDAATARMKAITKRLAEQYPQAQEGRSARIDGLRETVVGRVRPTLLVLLGAVAFVLLIACANVANLLLARAATRRRDVAIRAALGATRWRLARQYLTESLMLSVGGASLGALLAYGGLAALAKLSTNTLPAQTESIRLDGTVFGFLLFVAVATGIGFGLVPALQATSANLRDDLVEGGGKTTASGRQQRVRHALVVSEIALSLVLLVGAALMMRAFFLLRGMTPGLVAEHVLTFHVSVPSDKYRDKSMATQFYDPLLERLRALPGVRGVGATTRLPIQNWGTNGNYTVVGRREPDAASQPIAELRVVAGDFFSALGIPLKVGRGFATEDGLPGRNVILVNEALVRREFPTEHPIGKQIRRGGDPWTIVGVVGDVRQGGLDREPMPEIYYPYSNPEYAPWTSEMTLVVQTSGPPAALATAVRDAVRAVDPDQPIYAVRTMEEVIERSLANRRFFMVLLGVFASIALMLSIAGIYGVISYLVTQRTREIGIRMALGAQSADVVGLVMRQGAALASAGIAVGVVGALALTRLISGLLYGVGARDPLTFAAMALTLGSVALLATWIPARRAARVSPMLAIRSD
jgi:putative ABC transport system permease protein